MSFYVAATMESALTALENPELEHLELSAPFGVDANAMHQLAPAIQKSNITTLKICNIQGAGAVEALAPILSSTRITHLEFAAGMIPIGPDGAKVLAEILPATRITNLTINNQGIGNDGAAYLATALATSQASSLSILNNGITDDGVSSLLSIMPDAALTSLKLSTAGLSSSLRDASENQMAAMKSQTADAIEWWTTPDAPSERRREQWDAMAERVQALEMFEYGLVERSARKEMVLWAIEAHKEGFPVREFLLKALPLKQAMHWMEKLDQPAFTTQDFLNPDGSFIQDRFVCQQNAYAVFQQPDLWESRAQAEKAFRSLPDRLQAIIPRHQTMATIGQHEQANQQGRA